MGGVKLRYIDNIVSTAVEITAICSLVCYFLLGMKYQDRFIVVIVFTALFICFIYNKGLISRILNNKWFGFLGKYAYSIYVMQQISFWILAKTLWKTEIVDRPVACIGVSLMFCIAIGISTFYLIEKPMEKMTTYITVEKD